MKKIYTILVAVLLTASVFAQSPEKMSYQAVIRNSSDQLVVNQAIGMQISILQTTATGTAVYVETHNTTTNANGLVTVEIGNGTVISGDFTAIDWANDIYFIKTETDPITAGGTAYTITGTNQLLSVAYALHAKTAETIIGGITETDPVFTAWNKSYNDLTNKPAITDTVTAVLDTTTQFVRTEVDGSITNEIQTISRTGLTVTLTNGGTYQDSINTYTAGTGIDITNNVISTIPLAIGDSYQGGIIFWLDATGQHGLIAATADQSTGIQWYNGTYRFTGTTGDGLYAGAMNTAMIVATQMADNQTGNFAAKVCADYSVTVSSVTYGDWYLPSKYELNLLYQQKTAVGGFASADYWSSSEGYDYNAWRQYFGNGYQDYDFKDVTTYVRAIRAF